MGDPRFDSALAEAGWLRRLARSLVRDAHRADDAVQETLATALGERGRERSPRAWLAKVLKNELRQDARARGRRAFHEQRAARGGPAPSAGEVSERLELQRRLLEAVSALDEPYRSTLVARFFDELPPRAIARRDGVPIKTVNTRLERGLAKLRARLDGAFGGDRGAWLQVLAPLAGGAGLPWSVIGRGASMGAKARLGAAALVAALFTTWTVKTVLQDEPRAARSDLEERPGHASPTDGDADASSLHELLANEVVPDAPRISVAPARKGVPATPRDAGPALARLDVRVVKRWTGVPSETAKITVTDASDEDLAGPALLEGERDPLASGTTDAKGFVSLALPHGRALWVEVAPRTWEPTSRADATLEPLQRTRVRATALGKGEQRTLVVELEHGCDRTLEGRVVAADEGRGLAAARIEPKHDSNTSAVKSDELGAFVLRYASWDPPPSVSISHAGFTPVSLRPQWIDQEPGVPLVVALEREAAIAAHFEGIAAGRYELRARWTDHGMSPMVLDASGRCELPVPARIALDLELQGPDGMIAWSQAEPWTLEPGARRELVARIGTGVTVYGTLRAPDGMPLSGVSLWAVGAGNERVEKRTRFMAGELRAASAARTAADGHFEFAALASGSWWIGTAPDKPFDTSGADLEALAPIGIGVELPEGVTSRRVDLTSNRHAWITGRVTREDGAPVSEATVACTTKGVDGQLISRTRDGGAFRFGPLLPGSYELSLVGCDGVLGGPAKHATAQAGASGVELVLRLHDSIGGLVVDRAGIAVDSRVHLLQRGGSFSMSTSRSNHGAFLFVALPADVYFVLAEAPDGRVAGKRVELAEGACVSDVVLTLEEGSRINVRHDLDHDVRCAIWAGDALAADWTVRVGQDNFETVPAGPLRVELYSGADTLAVRELVGRAGRVESVEFVLGR